MRSKKPIKLGGDTYIMMCAFQVNSVLIGWCKRFCLIVR